VTTGSGLWLDSNSPSGLKHFRLDGKTRYRNVRVDGKVGGNQIRVFLKGRDFVLFNPS